MATALPLQVPEEVEMSLPHHVARSTEGSEISGRVTVEYVLSLVHREVAG